jgi:hypothetical protein
MEDRCGERLWRVTATVQGDGLSAQQPGTPLLLLKRNTFYSQWCQAKGGDGARHQVSSIRPSLQLFRPNPTRAADGDVEGFTGAALYPWFNVRRQEFYNASYVAGASEELAGRGLYGDYVLLFPKQVLDAGFPLERVEDILLRFDYLSVDDLPGLAGGGSSAP